MLLSLYTIANALYPLEVELHMTGDGSARYTDAGGLYVARDRLLIKHSGTTGVCTGVDGELIIHNVPNPEFFYLIRSIFSLYNKWESVTAAAVQEGRSLWDIFSLASGVLRAPAVIFDEDLVVAALNTTGFLACRNHPGLKGLRSLGKLNRMQRSQFLNDIHYTVHKGAPWFCPENNGLPPSCNVNLLRQGRNYGILTLFQGDIPLNPGHSQVLEQFARILSEYYTGRKEQAFSPRIPHLDVLLAALDGRSISQEGAQAVLRDCLWRPGEALCLATFAPMESTRDGGYLRYFRTHFESRLPHALVLTHQNRLVVLINLDRSGPAPLAPLEEALHTMPPGYAAAAGISLPFRKLEHAIPFYQQSQLALSLCTPDQPVCTFASQAPALMLSGSVPPHLLPYALFPGLQALWASDRAKHTGYCRTLMAYLRWERNVTAAAAALYLHRNTLLYRLHKLRDLLPADWDDPDTREYALLSLRLLEYWERTGSPLASSQKKSDIM